jgi:hypothetical protein
MDLADAVRETIGSRRDLDLLALEGARVRIQFVGGDYEDYPAARPRTMPGGGFVTLEPDDVGEILRHLAEGDEERAAQTFIDRFALRYGMSAIWVADVITLTIEPQREETPQRRV